MSSSVLWLYKYCRCHVMAVNLLSKLLYDVILKYTHTHTAVLPRTSILGKAEVCLQRLQSPQLFNEFSNPKLRNVFAFLLCSSLPSLLQAIFVSICVRMIFIEDLKTVCSSFSGILFELISVGAKVLGRQKIFKQEPALSFILQQ